MEKNRFTSEKALIYFLVYLSPPEENWEVSRNVEKAPIYTNGKTPAQRVGGILSQFEFPQSSPCTEFI